MRILFFLLFFISNFSNAIEIKDENDAIVVMGIRGVMHAVRFEDYDSGSKFEFFSTKRSPQVVKSGNYFVQRLKTIYANVGPTKLEKPIGGAGLIPVEPGSVTFLGVWDFIEDLGGSGKRLQYKFAHHPSYRYLNDVIDDHPELKKYPMHIVSDGHLYDVAWDDRGEMYMVVPSGDVEMKIGDVGLFEKNDSESSSFFHMVSSTDIVPENPGIGFGFGYKIKETSSGQREFPAKTKLTFQVFHPKFLNKNSTDKSGHPGVNVYKGSVYINQENQFIYQFDHDWEIVAGTWSLEVWSGDKLLGRKDFQVR